MGSGRGEGIFNGAVDFEQPGRANARLGGVSGSEVAEDDDPLRGLPYRALHRLGAGSMGEVFLAQHRQLGRLCVAKILHAEFAADERVGDRIRLEAQALGRMNHPHIVSIIGAGQTYDKRPFIVMEHLRGHTLADELDVRGSLPVLDALNYTCQLLRALAATHAIGIVHRDIKPANLFLCDGTRGGRTLKVLDFGVARVMPGAPPHAPEPLAVPTDTGVVVGTPRYVSPEGAVAQPVDHRADLYAAALVLYVMVAGCGPFDHIRSAPMLLSAQAAKEPEPPSSLTKEPIPPELDRVILRALRKTPGERFQFADEFRAELEQIIEHLQSSAGWMDTSTFDAASIEKRLAEVPERLGDERDGELAARQDAQLLAAHQAPTPQLSPVHADDSDVGSVPRASELRHEPPMGILKVGLIFIAAALLAATAALVVIAISRGAVR